MVPVSRGNRRRLPPVRKSLGQHFLADRHVRRRIVDTLAPRADETIVEIGPGRGALTDLLRERAGRVVAIEFDRALAAMLSERYAGDRRMRIVQADVLDINLADVAEGVFALIGNVPYNITTPILFHALQLPRPTRAVFLVQREVAERMRAGPGTRDYGALSVNLQAFTAIRYCFGVPSSAFRPPPKVESAVVELTPLSTPVIQPAEEQAFREMVQAAFALRRKQMKRVVRGLVPATRQSAEELLAELGIHPESRPERLTVAQFAALFRRLESAG